MYVWERSVGRCLSIVQLPRHHPVVGQSLIHRSEPLTWPRATISVTLGALVSRLVRPIRERTWWYVTCGSGRLAGVCALCSCPDTTRWWDNHSFTDLTRSPGPVPRYPLLSAPC